MYMVGLRVDVGIGSGTDGGTSRLLVIDLLVRHGAGRRGKRGESLLETSLSAPTVFIYSVNLISSLT